MEVTEGLVPPPGKQAVECANCAKEIFVDETFVDESPAGETATGESSAGETAADENAGGPYFCEECELDPGEMVVDRETGDLLVVVRTTDRQADEVEITNHDCTVAEYPNNGDYPADDVVVEAMYPVPAGLSPDDLKPHHLRRYSFPRGRLARRGENKRLNVEVS